jgi:hypothetical protein
MKKRMSPSVASKAGSEIKRLLNLPARNEREAPSKYAKFIFWKRLLIKGIDLELELLHENIECTDFNPRETPHSDRIYLRAALLQICLERDLPITMRDVHTIAWHKHFRTVFGSIPIINDTCENVRDMLHRTGFCAVSLEPQRPSSTSIGSGYIIRKYGRMSAKVSGGKGKRKGKSKESLVSEAKAATLKYYADVARKAQKNYMIKFNALTP